MVPTAFAKEKLQKALSFLDLEDPNKNFIRDWWHQLSPLPGGKQLFSRAVGFAARYTGTIRARVTTLEEGRCVAEMDDTAKVRNHLSSVHAIALTNLAELAGNLALAYSMPNDARFIVAGLSMEYVKKARGRITAEGTAPPIPTNERREYDVHVDLRNAQGETVARAVLKSLVGPKPGR